MHWTHTRHLQYRRCASFANRWRDSPAHDARSPIDRIAATGILVHQALEQILAEHVGLTTTQAYRNVRARDIVNCLRNLMEGVEYVGDPLVPLPNLSTMKSMVQNGLRRLIMKWPSAQIHGVEMELASEEVRGVIDLALKEDRSQGDHIILLDWKTRNARPPSTNNLQLAVYEQLASIELDSASVRSYLVLVHPKQNTLLMVTNSEDFHAYVEQQIRADLNEWNGLDIGSVPCTCGHC